MSIVPYSGNYDYTPLIRYGARTARNMLRGTRSRYTGPVGSVLATKRDVLRLYQTVQSRRPEMKFRDFPLTNGGQLAGSIISVDLGGIPQGVTRNDRIGSKINMKGIQIRGRISTNNTNLAIPTLMVLRSFNNATPTIADFNTQLGVFAEPREFKEHMSYTPATTLVGSIKRNINFGKRGYLIRYTGTGTGTTIGSKFFMVVVNPLGGNTQNVSLNARVWYTDA